MVTRKKPGNTVEGAGAILSTVSGPSNAPPPTSLGNKNATAEQLLQKATGNMQLAADMPFNPNKAGEHGQAAYTPQPGATVEPATPA